MVGWGLVFIVFLAGICIIVRYCDWILMPGAERIRKRILESPARIEPFFFDETPKSIARRMEREPLLRSISIRLKSEEGAMLRPTLFDRGNDDLPPDYAPHFLKRVVHLSFKHLVFGDRSSLEMVLGEMRYVAGLKSWSPSDHLAHAVMTAAMAIGYNWLSRDLDAVDRIRFSRAILRNGLRPIQMPIPGNWWKVDSFNHAQVGYGCLGVAACALIEDYPEEASKVLAICIANMPRVFKQAYRENGEYVEGPSYWIYGTTYTVLFLSALEKTFGHAFQLDNHPVFLNSSRYFLHCHGPTTQVANFSDSHSHSGPAEIMFWFARKLGDPTLSWFEVQKVMDRIFPADQVREHSGPLLPLICLWADHCGTAQAPREELCWVGDKASSLIIHRSGWGKDAYYIALKGGSPGARHAHMDAGAFILEMRGVRWGIDLGNVDYELMKNRGIYLWHYHQRAARWKVFRLNNFSHNTLSLNGKLQNPGGRARIVSHSHSGPQHRSVMDLSDLYNSEAKRVFRTISLLPGGEDVLIEDEIVARERPVMIRWGMATRAAVHCLGKTMLRLEEGGERIWLTHSGVGNTEWRIFDLDPPPTDHDEPNPGTCMIGFTVAVESGGSIRLSVRFQSALDHFESVDQEGSRDS